MSTNNNERLIDILAAFFYQNNYSDTILRESTQNAGDSLCNEIRVYVDEINKTLIVKDNGVGIKDEKYIRDLAGTQKFTSNPGGSLGLAKAVLLSKNDNSIESIGKKYTKKHLIDSELKAYESDITNGTVYTGFDYDKSEYGTRKYLESLLFGDIKIYLNDEIVNCRYTLHNDYCNEIMDVYIDKMSCNHVTISVNGVASFNYSFPNLRDSMLVNFKFHGDILENSELFPLTANRDNLKPRFHSMVVNLPEVKESIEKTTVQESQRIARQSHLSSCNVIFGKMVIGGKNETLYSTGEISDMSKGEKSQVLKDTTYMISTYKRYIEQINAIEKNVQNDNLRFGYVNYLTDGTLAGACYKNDGVNHCFFINPANYKMSKGDILGLALHEYAHITAPAHDENYSGVLTDLIGRIANCIFTGEFRK